MAPADVPEISAVPSNQEDRALLRSTYRVLDQLRSPERIAFSLRIIAGLEMSEVASACGVSLTTIKRRLHRAESRFLKEARRDPALRERIEHGHRWSPS